MPALTTARTTAFIPALSPPDVRIAIFILVSELSPMEWVNRSMIGGGGELNVREIRQ